jgi:hypothetical protein
MRLERERIALACIDGSKGRKQFIQVEAQLGSGSEGGDFSQGWLSIVAEQETGTMRKQFKAKLNGDESRKDASAAFMLPFDTRQVWGKAKVPVKVTINGYTWRSTVGNRGGIQYVVVNAEARRGASVKAGDFVTIALEPDTEKRVINIPVSLRKALGTKLAQKLNSLSFTHKTNLSSGIPKLRRRTRVLAG